MRKNIYYKIDKNEWQDTIPSRIIPVKLFLHNNGFWEF